MLTHLLFYIYIDTPNCKKMGIFVANGHPVVLIQNLLCMFFFFYLLCVVWTKTWNLWTNRQVNNGSFFNVELCGAGGIPSFCPRGIEAEM